MKSFASALAVFLFAGWISPLAADVTYRATLKGIECNACKKTIAKSLGGLPGVQTIRIAKRTEELHDMTVLTDGSASITKANAIKALGKKAPHYQIVTWSRTN